MTARLRAARWSRVSSAQQATDDRNGLPAQLEEQDRGIATLNAVDTGIAWSVTESGATVHETPEYRDMLAQAGKTFDVLVVAYVSRLGRNTIESLRAAELIEEAGASVYFAQEGINTHDERQWPAFAGAVVSADAGRRQLRITMRGSYESRWRRRGIPAGRPPLGYQADWRIDPDAAAIVRSLFTEYATGAISIEKLAEKHDLALERVKEILRNRTYLGLAGHRVYDPASPRVARYRRVQQWRDGHHEAIVDQELFERVAQMRSERQRAGGPRSLAPSMLQGRLWCGCGTAVRLDGRDGVGQRRVLHPDPCEAWGPAKRRQARYFTEPMIEALRSIQLTPAEVDRIVQNVSPAQPVRRPIDWKARRRALRDLFDSAKVDAAEFISRGAALQEEEASSRALPSAAPALTPEAIRAFFADFQTVIAYVSRRGLEEDLWANVVAKYFSRIEYVDGDHLRPVPNDTGLAALIAATLPSQVVLARPEGFEPPTC